MRSERASGGIGSNRAATPWLLAALLLGLACSEGASTSSSNGDEPDPARAAAALRGRQIYGSVCVACHNGDPTQPGSLGPQIAGASLELLEAKVLRAEYPPGYTPLRPTQAMPKFEYLKGRLGDVEAYLQQD